jgi:excisionase family DNA binding protein
MPLPQRLPTLSVKEAAKALGLHPSTLYRWVDAGDLEHIRYGKHPDKDNKTRGSEIRIPESVVAELLRRGPVVELVDAA